MYTFLRQYRPIDFYNGYSIATQIESDRLVTSLMQYFLSFAHNFSHQNLANLLTLVPSTVDISKTPDISTNSEILSNESPNYGLLTNLTKILMSFFRRETEREVQLNSATLQSNR